MINLSLVLLALTGLPDAATDDDYYPAARPKVVELGRLLFFDKILSGNQNISCATCHHPELGTGDGVSLPLGEGAVGVGPARAPSELVESALHGRVPRNSQALFNLGAVEYVSMFHDGRVEVDADGNYASGFISPAKWKLPTGLDNVLAAQAMFPVTSADEMAGQKGENPIADAVSLNDLAGPAGAWELLARRLRENPSYVKLFSAAFPDVIEDARDIELIHAANAIGAFEAAAFRSDNSAFDVYLRDPKRELSAPATRGMELFYGRAGCGSCHSGTFQTDHDFHAIAMPQIGPGKGHGSDAGYWRATGIESHVEDFGRGRVTYRPEDDYKFRTPSLRNVAITGPWGHAGSYSRLEDVVRHHVDPIGSLSSYDLDQAVLPSLGQLVELTARGARLTQSPLSAHRARGVLRGDGWVQSSAVLRKRIERASSLSPVALSDADIADVVAFLHTLTDPTVALSFLTVPAEVPSGLPVDRGRWLVDLPTNLAGGWSIRQ